MTAPPDDGISTDRLILERLQLSHAEEMVAVLADDRLYGFTGGDAPSLDVLTDRYRRQIHGSGRHDEEWFNWIARRIETDEVVGFVQATVVNQRAEVAWLVAVNHQRQGFASEAAEAMVARLARNGVSEFAAHIAVDHVASARVAERLGMARSGLVDENGEEVWLRVDAVQPDQVGSPSG